MSERTRWTDLTGFQRDVVEAIAKLDDEGALVYGIAIKKQLERWYDDEINHGRLYPNLDQLVDAGLVEKSELDKRTNEYALTGRGRDRLEERVHELAEVTGVGVWATATDGGER